MLDEEEYGSDTSDDDYRPSDGEAVSEEEGSGEEEDLTGLKKDASDMGSVAKGKKKTKRKRADQPLPRKRKGGIRLEDETEAKDDAAQGEADDDFNKNLQVEIEKEKETKKEEEEKKKADSLWASFMSDIPTTSRPKPAAPKGSGLGSLGTTMKNSPARSIATTTTTTSSAKPVSAKPAAPAKVTITKEYDFAGETVQITKEVAADSKEAKAEMQKKEDAKTTASPVIPGLKRPHAGGGGLGSVLGKIGKKSTISTLDKSKLDWEKFKNEQGIDEELSIHNRGKGGYVERQRFLERADLRQFELERDLRLKTSKR